MNPKLSIIIPLFNKKRHIADTLDSVFKQTYSDFEIILVNDGSTDGSLDIIKRIKDGRLKIFTIENSGVSYARNFGILRASTDLIAFLDADDLWLPNHLEDLMQLHDSFPDCGLYCSSYLRRRDGLEIRPTFNTVPEDDSWSGVVSDYFRASLTFPVAWTSAVMVPKRIFNLVGTFDTSITLGAGEDTDLWIRIAKAHKVALINRPSAIHQLGADNRLTHTLPKNRVYINLDKFSVDAESNASLKTYLEVQRFAIALQYKMAGDKINFERIYQKIDRKALNWKQKLLLILPMSILLKMRKFQTFFLKRTIYLTAFR